MKGSWDFLGGFYFLSINVALNGCNSDATKPE